MRKGYTIRHQIDNKCDLFYLHNFNAFNEVVYYGFKSNSLKKKSINSTCIGVWKIKSAQSSE
jgi:hypothetical protein